MAEARAAEPAYRPWLVAWGEALYGASGFYRRAEGPRGHFETSANAGGGVADLLAEALLALAARHGCRRIVDVGAGRGELLSALASSRPRSAGPVEVALTGVDVVPRPAGLPDQVGWMTSRGGPHLPPDLADLERTLVIAHEWLDVVPCAVLEVDGRGRLRVVEVDDAGDERLGEPAGPAELAWCARWWPVDDAAPGTRAEVGLARDRAWADLVARVRSGVVLAVDYGHVAAQRPPLGTLAAHRAGHLVRPVPDGSCDLTADVAWDSLAAAASTSSPAGGAPDQPALLTQREALTGLGVDPTRPALGGDPAAYLLDLQRAAAAATLLDPGGLGGLGWLVQEVATGHAATAPARVEP